MLKVQRKKGQTPNRITRNKEDLSQIPKYRTASGQGTFLYRATASTFRELIR